MSTSIAIGGDTLGWPLPSALHAVLASIPSWCKTVEYMQRRSTILNAMVTGYPRFFIHRSVQRLADICQEKLGMEGEQCLLFLTRTAADQGKEFIHAQALRSGKPTEVRVVDYSITPRRCAPQASPVMVDVPVDSDVSPLPVAKVHMIFFRTNAYRIAKQFWQNSGLGISSRYAEHCLSILGEPEFPRTELSEFLHSCGKPASRTFEANLVPKIWVKSQYPLDTGEEAKAVLRQRIASFLVPNELCESVQCVSQDDVFLFPCGMSALWSAHHLLLGARPVAKSVAFGFCYSDTLSVIERNGPGATFYGFGSESDIDDLDSILSKAMAEDSSKPPILALYTECPSIPLLHTVNLRRLRALADKYDFLIVIDDTVGTFINVDLMSYADILVTSLSKFFSGYATALGGSLVLNPRMRHYAVLKAKFMSTYEDTYFDADAIVMEQNSRDFLDRMHIINSNAEYICDFLLSYSTGNAALQGGDRNAPVIKQVYYPKYISRENYDTCRRPPFTSQLHEKGGEYGGVFSLTFTSLAASRAFYDTLAVAKGPSFGTTFTLSCLYTLLNHYSDLEWAAKYGVDEGLVRVSVGTEDRGVLLRIMEAALRAAELAA